jgi:hypothetical protein
MANARIERLRAAADQYERARERVESVGREALETAAEFHRRYVRLLDGYEDSATGSGFQQYIEFQDEVAALMEEVPEEVPGREAFEAADETLQQRRLSTADFEHAREDLAPAREHAEGLTALADAREELRAARREVQDRLDGLDARIDDLERLLALDDADLDAPTERLREPVETYNDAVRDAFVEFRRGAPAREMLDLLERAAACPLVDVERPPERLHEYVRRSAAGDEPIPTLLEFADYSASKLSHYVDDPDQLRRRVATNRTYLSGLEAEPLTVDWPPPPADELRPRSREYEAVCHRFAPEDVVAALRDVRALARQPDYERLRRAAAARAELTEDERRRLASGAVEDELAAAREERAELGDALEAVPEP